MYVPEDVTRCNTKKCGLSCSALALWMVLARVASDLRWSTRRGVSYCTGRSVMLSRAASSDAASARLVQTSAL
jgi:hypothetical protein